MMAHAQTRNPESPQPRSRHPGAAHEHPRNRGPARNVFALALEDLPLVWLPHIEFKKRVPQAIGLIRTADTVQYANLIPESAEAFE